MNTEGQNYRLTMANMPVFNTPKVTVTTKVVMPVMPASRNAASTAKHESHSASQNVIRKNDPKPIPEYDVRALVGPVKKNRTPFLVAAITANGPDVLTTFDFIENNN